MAGKQKHAERSHRSYRQNKANLRGFSNMTFAKSQRKQQMKENKSLFSKLFGRKSKGDK